MSNQQREKDYSSFDFYAAMDCFTSLHVVSSAVRNERRMSSNVAGSKRLVRRRGLNTKAHFAVGC